MRVEQGLVAALSGDATVSGLVGTRIYHLQGPQGAAYPFITYQRTSTVQGVIFDGVDTLTTVGISIDAWGESAASVQAVAAAIRGVLNGFTGSLGGVTVQFVRQESSQDLGDFDGDTEIRRVSADFSFLLHET